MYRTAKNLEDLDWLEELQSFESVSFAADRGMFWSIEDQYHDADFYLYMVNHEEKEEILKLLKEHGMKAYLDFDEAIEGGWWKSQVSHLTSHI